MRKVLEASDARTSDALIRQAEEGRKAFEPEVTLFVSDSPESKQAQAVLETSEEPFRTIKSSDPRTPVAIFGFSAYEKLSGIEALVAELSAFDADVQSAYEKR